MEKSYLARQINVQTTKRDCSDVKRQKYSQYGWWYSNLGGISREFVELLSWKWVFNTGGLLGDGDEAMDAF